MEPAHPPHAPWNRKRELKRSGTRHGPQDVQQGLPIARFHLLSVISFQFFSNYESTCQSMHRFNPFPKSTTIKCCCNGTNLQCVSISDSNYDISCLAPKGSRSFDNAKFAQRLYKSPQSLSSPNIAQHSSPTFFLRLKTDSELQAHVKLKHKPLYFEHTLVR